jgi:hypothetical protein
LALAAFLAELALASHTSALVFDDPVSSLDFSHCRGISKRLALEAKLRQVIVFTHHVAFLSDLSAAAKHAGVAPTYRCIEWAGSSPGGCRDGLPWLLQPPRERLAVLEQARVRLDKQWNPLPNNENKLEMGQLYSLLRAIIERVVEVDVLDNALTRFDSYIRVGKLRTLVGFTQAEFEQLYALFKKASDIIEGHDAAAGNPPPIPTPQELKQDMDDLQATINIIKRRSEANRKSGASHAMSGPPKSAPQVIS